MTAEITPIVLVAARAENGVIGSHGTLPWPRLEGDLPRFKALTMGKPCIMGRKTWDSLPKKPLVGRTNIVVTRNPAFAAEGAISAASLDDAIALAAKECPSEIMIIGGAEIFAAALPLAARVELTEVHAAPEGDVRLAAFSPPAWREVRREPAGPTHSYVVLERIGL